MIIKQTVALIILMLYSLQNVGTLEPFYNLYGPDRTVIKYIKETNTTDKEEVTKTETLDEENQKSKEHQYNQILNTNPAEAAVPETQSPEVIETSYREDFNWYDTVTLSGIFSTESLYFFIPEYWDYKYSVVQIQYEISQVIKDVPATLTVSVNNIPVTSIILDYNQGKTQIAYVLVPVSILRHGYNVIDVSGYVRLYNDEGCIDENSGANWINIHKNSYIRVGYELLDHNRLISNFPYPFMSTIDKTGSNTSIVISDKMENGEIAAAMYLLAGISDETTGENNITIETFKTIEQKNKIRKILISKKGNLSDKYEKYIGTNNDLETRALLRFIEEENGNPTLLIISNSDECLMEAVYMLLDEERVFQEKQDLTYVENGSSAMVQNALINSQELPGTYTLRDIIGTGLSFVGPFHQQQYVALPRSSEYILGDGGEVSLKFRYSENLDFSRSLITVYWGNIPVASKKLRLENAKGDELTFKFPSDVVGTLGTSLSVAFDLEIEEMYCTQRQDQMPWAYVTADSTIYLPSSTNSPLSFDTKPVPFQKNKMLNDVMLVLPKEPTIEELNIIGKVLGMYGAGVLPYGRLKTIRANEFLRDDANYNIITVGTFLDNTFISSINSLLHFKYENDGTKFLSNEQLVLSPHYASDIATFQLIKSPFAEDKVILAICGTNNKNLSYASDFVRVEANRWGLIKDCVIIDSDLNSKSFQFNKDTISDEKPNFTQYIKENKRSLVFTVVSTSAMLLLFLSVVIILLRIRKYNKKSQ